LNDISLQGTPDCDVKTKSASTPNICHVDNCYLRAVSSLNVNAYYWIKWCVLIKSPGQRFRRYHIFSCILV